ncbi:uncharacterized protein PAE49_005385 isoform 2-T2 [Odontesthes bonariensis]|uniref:uncharacterized protein LOC142380467 n=1 Tax=Odontesthes bonariensis TaxID=219752 RepID=UPI003F58734E
MPNVVLTELHHSLVMTKWGWTPWMLLFTLSGSLSLVTVYQPPVLAAARGGDVTMHCELRLSQNEIILNSPVLYWLFLEEANTENSQLWNPSAAYKERVRLLDDEQKSLNKSILLRNVQWADSGRYQCKLSVTIQGSGSFRRSGNQTTLKVYEPIVFTLSGHNDSLLRCEVNATQDAGFALTVTRDGFILQTDSAEGVVEARPYVTLSETASVRGRGEYECQLRLGKDLITKSIFHANRPAGESGGAEDRAAESVHPEPWILYSALLLVPVVVLLSLLISMLMQR